MKQPVKIGNRDKSKTYHDYPLYIAYAIGFLPLVLILVCAFMISADAGNGYVVTWSYTDSQASTGNTYSGQYEISNKYPMFFIRFEHNGMYQLGEYVPEEKETYQMSWSGNHTGDVGKGERMVIDKDGKLIRHDIYPMVDPDGTAVDLRPFAYTIAPRDSLMFSCNCYVFDSLESAKAYYTNGDGSGIVSRPSIPDNEDDYHHDFRKDNYDATMPVPECSNFSHNGFTVNNARDDLFIAIVVESKLYGVKHSIYDQKLGNPTNSDNQAGYTFLYDSSWIYASHYYNIGDLSDIAVNKSKINIKDLWNTDNEGALINDFKKWSEKYPSHKLLPSYKFMTHGNPFSGYQEKYEQRHIYKYNSSINDSEQLSKSGQAETSFHVRFYDKNLKYSRWVTYTYRNGQYTRTDQEPDDVESGFTEPDRDGNPTVPDPDKGKQDPETGDVDYSYDNGTSTIDSSDLWATIKGLVNNMGAIPEIIGEVLSFLPQWVLYMIAAGIAACVVLRFVGR